MAINPSVNTQYILNEMLSDFYVSTPFVQYADTTTFKNFKADTWAIGETVQIRKRPRFPVSQTAITTTGPIALPFKDIEQEVEDITVEYFFNVAVSANQLERMLKLNSQAALQDTVIQPMVASIKAKVTNYIYSKILEQCYIFTGDPSSRISTVNQIADATSLMDEFQMDKGNRYLMLSTLDAASIRSALGSYFQSSVSSPALRGDMTALDGFKMLFSDNNIRTHVAGAASTSGTWTLSAPVSNGDTTLSLTGGAGTETFKKGDILTLTANAPDELYALTPRNKEAGDGQISNDQYNFSFVVAADATAAGGNVVVSVSRAAAIQQTVNPSQFANVRSIVGGTQSNQIPTGTNVAVMINHKLNPAITPMAITIAAPPMPDLSQSGGVKYMKAAMENGISIATASQGIVSTWSSDWVVGVALGASIHPEYMVGIVSKG